jgi:hypothetical protein
MSRFMAIFEQAFTAAALDSGAIPLSWRASIRSGGTASAVSGSREASGKQSMPTAWGMSLTGFSTLTLVSPQFIIFSMSLCELRTNWLLMKGCLNHDPGMVTCIPTFSSLTGIDSCIIPPAKKRDQPASVCLATADRDSQRESFMPAIIGFSIFPLPARRRLFPERPSQ